MAEFTRKQLMGLVNITKRPTKFLKNTFFGNVRTFDSIKVELDIDIEVRAMATYIKRGSVATPTNDVAWKTNEYQPPLISLDSSITEKNLERRAPGETVYNGTGMSTKAYYAARKIAKLDSMISLREEFQAMEALFSGKVTVGADEISFGRDAALTVVNGAGDVWTNAAANPYDQFTSWRDLIAEKSGTTPTDVIMGASAWTALKTHAGFMALLDKLKVNIGNIDPLQVAPGVFRVMRLNEIGDFWIYPEKYIDPSDATLKDLIPANKIAYVSRGAERHMLYGGIALADENGGIEMVSGERVMDSEIRKNPAMEVLYMHSAPLACLTNPNGVLSATVI